MDKRKTSSKGDNEGDLEHYVSKYTLKGWRDFPCEFSLQIQSHRNLINKYRLLLWQRNDICVLFLNVESRIILVNTRLGLGAMTPCDWPILRSHLALSYCFVQIFGVYAEKWVSPGRIVEILLWPILFKVKKRFGKY